MNFIPDSIYFRIEANNNSHEITKTQHNENEHQSINFIFDSDS